MFFSIFSPSVQFSGHIPLLPPCQQHLVDPALRVGRGVQGGLSHLRDQSLQLVPKMSSHSWILFAIQHRNNKIWPIQL